jgi:hypothetical protein
MDAYRYVFIFAPYNLIIDFLPEGGSMPNRLNLPSKNTAHTAAVGLL